MRRITLVVVGTIAVLVLLFSYRTSTGGSAVPGGAASPPGVVRAAPGTGGRPATSVPPAGTTVDGASVDNGYGNVQVRVHISGRRIVDVSTLSLPGDGHSQQINSFAVPQLRKEALSRQSSHIDTVSGATLTSEAYRDSLQAALDAAHFRAGS
ncbi:MAG: FMN-binding protein [Actinocatenispora sp.]